MREQHTDRQTYIQTDIHTYIHTYIHTDIHTYIHTDRQTELKYYIRLYAEMRLNRSIIPFKTVDYICALFEYNERQCSG